MQDARSYLDWLRDPRLSAYALEEAPAWLWTAQATRILWANPAGAAALAESIPARLSERRFDAGVDPARDILHLAPTLAPAHPPRLARLRGFGDRPGQALLCTVSRIPLANSAEGLLIVAAEPVAPALTLAERSRRLLAGCEEPLAIFSSDGAMIGATAAAGARLGSARSLAALQADVLGRIANELGVASGETAFGQASLERLGQPGTSALLLTLAPEHENVASEVASSPPAYFDISPIARALARVGRDEAPLFGTTPPSDEATVPSTSGESVRFEPQPVRFVWQMDAHGRFTLGSDEFHELIGPRIAIALGRPWDEIAAVLELDSDGALARAVASRENWSGLVTTWPVDGSRERLRVELSGLPVFDQDRNFLGYRGFGICRDLAQIAAVMEQRRAASIAEPTDLEPAAGGNAPDTKARPAGNEPRPLLTLVPSAPNVVPFPTAAAGEAKRLTVNPIEAFRELARRLDDDAEVDAVEAAPSTPVTDERATDESTTDEGAKRADAEPQSEERQPETAPGDRGARNDTRPAATALAALNHQVRAPLNSILGFADMMLRERYGPIGNGRYRRYVEDIRASGEQIATLLDAHLELANVETAELVPADLDLNALVHAGVELAQSEAVRHRVVVRRALASGLAAIRTDEAAARRMIARLLSNAVESAAPGGQVIVSTLASGGRTTLHVRGNGPALHEPEADLAPSGPGLGALIRRTDELPLGLALVRALAEANGATFRILRRPDRACVMEIQFATGGAG